MHIWEFGSVLGYVYGVGEQIGELNATPLDHCENCFVERVVRVYM